LSLHPQVDRSKIFWTFLVPSIRSFWPNQFTLVTCLSVTFPLLGTESRVCNLQSVPPVTLAVSSFIDPPKGFPLGCPQPFIKITPEGKCCCIQVDDGSSCCFLNSYLYISGNDLTLSKGRSARCVLVLLNVCL
jgi:hypothetical protein